MVDGPYTIPYWEYRKIWYVAPNFIVHLVLKVVEVRSAG